MMLTKQDISEIRGAIDGSFKLLEVRICKKIDEKIDDLIKYLEVKLGVRSGK